MRPSKRGAFREAEQAAEALNASHQAEAGIDAAQTELEKTAKALKRAQESERRARDEAAELRGQLKAAAENPKN